jgi:O-antigen ligase
MESHRLIHRIALSLWVLFLPFWDLGAGVALIVAFIAKVLPNLHEAKRKWVHSMPFWPIWGILLMVLLSSFWHETSPWYVARYLPLILLYWAFDREVVVRTLPIGALILIGYLFGIGILKVWQGAGWSTMVYRELLEGFHQHVYIGTYVLLASLAVYVQQIHTRLKAGYWAISLLFLGLLGAKMLVVSAGIVGVWFLFTTRRFPRWVLPACALFAIGFMASEALSSGRALGHVIKPLDPYWATGSVDTRAVQAKAAIQASSEKIWLGWGPSKKQSALEAVYTDWNYRFGLKRHLNVHNQYLEWLLAYGLCGIAILVGTFLMGFRRMRKGTWQIVLLYFGSIWLTESFMERSLGVALFALAWAWSMENTDANQKISE